MGRKEPTKPANERANATPALKASRNLDLVHKDNKKSALTVRGKGSATKRVVNSAQSDRPGLYMKLDRDRKDLPKPKAAVPVPGASRNLSGVKKNAGKNQPTGRSPTAPEAPPERTLQERELTIKEKDSANKRAVTWARTGISGVLAIAVLLGLFLDKNGPAIAAAAVGLIERWAKTQ
jgi:hypothetical protein